MQGAQKAKKNFEVIFDSWLDIAKKNANSEAVANINKIAHKCFKWGERELDVSNLLSGMPPATVEHAKINYHAAFLVVTYNLDQLIRHWHDVKDTAQRAALLRAVIAANREHITDDMLYKFLTSTKIEVDSGWFINDGNKTSAYHAFIASRPSKRTGEARTPKQFYDECLVEAKSKLLVSKPVSTTTSSTVQATAPVGKVEALTKSVPLKTVFLHMYLSDLDMESSINIPQFTDNISEGNYVAVEQLIKQTVCKMAKINGIKACKSYAEAKKDMGTAQFYPAAFIVQVQVNEKAIKENHTGLVLCDAVDPEAVTLIDFKLQYTCKTNITSNCCFTLASPELLETVAPQAGQKAGYFYHDANENPCVTVVYSDSSREELRPSEYDIMPFTYQSLQSISLPTEGIKKVLGGGQIDRSKVQPPAAIINELGEAKRYSSLKLFELYTKLQQVRKLTAEGKIRSDNHFLEILKPCINKMLSASFDGKYLLATKMKKLLKREILSMREATKALLLLQGHQNPTSPLHNLPKELMSILINSGLEVELEKIEKLHGV